MKAITLITAIASLAYITGHAQDNNLVMNGSFEGTDGKVSGRAQGDRADSMSSSNNTTVDLYSKEASCSKDYQVPNNYMGSQESKTGNNYAGITAYYADEVGIFKTKPGYQKYSEYIQLTLREPMTAGKAYTVTFNVSLAERSAYAVSGLGVYFSAGKMDVKNNAFLDVTPHIITTEIVSNNDWMIFTGTYVAQGGERYMTLGCFDDYMVAQKIIPEQTNNSRKAYYFIDDVGVSPNIISNDDITMILAGSCYQLKNLNFETDKAVILSDSYDELNALADFLKTYPYIVVYIDGHTDNTGTDQHNDKLSEQRAEAVKAYLIAEGVAENRMKARAYGETQPIDKQNENSLTNRRVEITICGDPINKSESINRK